MFGQWGVYLQRCQTDDLYSPGIPRLTNYLKYSGEYLYFHKFILGRSFNHLSSDNASFINIYSDQLIIFVLSKVYKDFTSLCGLLSLTRQMMKKYEWFIVRYDLQYAMMVLRDQCSWPDLVGKGLCSSYWGGCSSPLEFDRCASFSINCSHGMVPAQTKIVIDSWNLQAELSFIVISSTFLAILCNQSL